MTRCEWPGCKDGKDPKDKGVHQHYLRSDKVLCHRHMMQNDHRETERDEPDAQAQEPENDDDGGR